MNMAEIKEKAKQLGIQAGKIKKGDLIRAIQEKEGNFPCFETAKEYCSQLHCSWRKACLPAKEIKKSYEQTRDLSIKKIKKELDALTTTLADLKKKSRKTLGKGKDDLIEEIRKIEEKNGELKKKVHELAAAGEDAWEAARAGINRTLNQLRRAVKKTLS